jgi:group I intron endonuclease
LPSGKKYYGFTINLENRKRNHKCNANVGTKGKFYNAIRKYGWDSIKWEIIEEHKAESKKELKNILSEREIFWISKSNTYQKGYNMTTGGDGVLGLTWGGESKEKLSKAQEGRTLSESWKENIRMSRIGKISGMKDKHHQEQTKQNIRKRLERIKRSEKTRDKMRESKMGKNNPMYGKNPWNKEMKINETI